VRCMNCVSDFFLVHNLTVCDGLDFGLWVILLVQVTLAILPP